jgi:hypothetical protein
MIEIEGLFTFSTCFTYSPVFLFKVNPDKTNTASTSSEGVRTSSFGRLRCPEAMTVALLYRLYDVEEHKVSPENYARCIIQYINPRRGTSKVFYYRAKKASL